MDGAPAGVADAGAAWSFHPVGVVAGSLGHAGVGAVPRPGLRWRGLVMPAMIAARMRFRWSGGKGRLARGLAADDPDVRHCVIDRIPRH